MNKTELKKLYKKELHQIETEKLVLKQALSSITHRENTLKEALEKLGAPTPNPTLKGKYQLDPKVKLEVIASLTR